MTQAQQKTIAIVANSTWNIYNFRINVIDRFLKAGYKVVVVAPIDEYLEYKEKYPKIEHFGIRTLDRDSTNPIKDLILLLELTRRYRKIKPDLVIHYTNKPNIFGAFAARLNNLKSIAIVTGLGYPFIRKGWIRKVTSFLYKLSARYHKRIIFENIEDRELFEKSHIISTDKGISIKGCGVNTQFYQPRQQVKKHDKIIFSFIGRLLYDKGIAEFVKASKIIRKTHSDVEFWVIGELDPDNPATVEKDMLGEWVNENIINYFGFQRDVRTIISESDCIVLPSYREAIPRTITEGMAMAKPVITTDTAGCREAVEEGKNGYLVQTKNVESLVEAMHKMINLSQEERHEMGLYGRQKVLNEFDDKKIADQILQIAEDVING